MKRPVEILTERCALLEMRTEDSVFWFNFMNNPKVSKFLPSRISSVEEMTDILNWLSSNYDSEALAVHRLTLSVKF